MLKHCAIGSFTQKFYQLIQRLPEHLVLCCLCWCGCCPSHRAITLVGSIEILAPAAALQAENHMISLLLAPGFGNDAQRHMNSQAGFFLSRLSTMRCVPGSEKGVGQINDQEFHISIIAQLNQDVNPLRFGRHPSLCE